MAHRGRRRVPQQPFYEAPALSGQDAAQRVVQDVRASVRSLATSRPFTPADTSRGLFGASGRPASGPTARPTSAYSIGRKQFLANLDTTAGLDRPPSASPGGVRLAPLPDNQPQPPAPRPPSRRLPSAKDGSAVRPSSGRRALPQAPADEFRGRTSSASSPGRPPTRPGSGRRGVSSASAAGDAGSPRKFMPRPPAASNGAGGSESASARRSTSADKSRISTAQALDSAVWSEIEVILEDLTPEGELNSLYSLCDRLDAIVLEHRIRSGKQRSTVLRGIFRLLDMKDPRLLTKVARVVLRVTKSGPTLSNACKLLFKLSRNQANDTIFAEEKMAEPVISILEHASRAQSAEALIYCCGTIKNIGTHQEAQSTLVQAGVLEAMSNLLADISSEGPNGAANTTHLIVQLTAALRNLATNEDLFPQFRAAGIIGGLCPILSQFTRDSDVALNVSRILSKLTLDSECRFDVLTQKDVIPQLLQLAVMHRHKTALAVRVYFILGNLTAEDDTSREEVFASSEAGHLLFRELGNFIKEDQVKSAERSAGDEKMVDVDEDDADSKGIVLSEDVLVKVIRLIANLCINPEIGAAICNYAEVELLVNLLMEKNLEDSHELVLNIIGTINNMTFYHSAASPLNGRWLEIAEYIVPFLMHENMEVVVETARVFGTFSQLPEIRQLLHSQRADELMVVLLDDENAEMVFTVCGVLMNMMADAQYRSVLRDANGIGSLIEVMLRAEHTDWQLAGMACKTLWNLSEQLLEQRLHPYECFGEEETMGILDTLDELLDASTMEGASEAEMRVYQTEFAPVAFHLHKRISTHVESEPAPPTAMDLEPLSEIEAES
eukprot:m.18019 g.18019  ORF g.18019 m.18019 type:complete len:838 (-) comp3638_c0_seq1:199-2712(-)